MPKFPRKQPAGGAENPRYPYLRLQKQQVLLPLVPGVLEEEELEEHEDQHVVKHQKQDLQEGQEENRICGYRHLSGHH